MVTVAKEVRSAAPSGRKQALIDATTTAIAEHGLSNVTLAKIADIAGLTAGSVNFHFDSKEALLLATLRHVSEEFSEEVDRRVAQAADDAADALSVLVDTSLDAKLTSPGKIAVWYSFHAESHTRGDYLRLCGERDDAYYRTVLNLCRRLIDEEPGADRINAEAVAYALVGLIDQLWQEALFDGDKFDRKSARRRCRAYLASVFPGRFSMPGKTDEMRAPSVKTSIPELAPVEEKGLKYTLPSWVYDSDEFFELEKSFIHLPAWQTVCHVSDLPEPGSYHTLEMLGERAFVVRGDDNTIRAFHNVCRHRAHSVVQGESGYCAGHLQCPYHGWMYNFDGSNRGISEAKTFAPVDRSKFGLKPLDVEVFHGFVFIRFVSGGPTVAEQFGPWAAEFGRYRSENMVHSDKIWVAEYDADWKNVVENYVEDYHFPLGHPSLSALMERDYDREVDAGGVFRLSHRMREQPKRWSSKMYRKVLPDYEHLPEEMRDRWTYFGLFPGSFFDMYPDQADFWHVVPVAPGRVRLRSRGFHFEDNLRESRAARFLANRINTATQSEDDALTIAVQGGLRSSGYDVGILSGKENVVKGFQDWIRAKLPVSRLLRAPRNGTAAENNRLLSTDQ